MHKIRQHLTRFLLSEDGPTAVEYAVMLAMILLACLVGIGALSTSVSGSFSNSSTRINSAMSGS